jgi:hypothetical protein
LTARKWSISTICGDGNITEQPSAGCPANIFAFIRLAFMFFPAASTPARLPIQRDGYGQSNLIRAQQALTLFSAPPILARGSAHSTRLRAGTERQCRRQVRNPAMIAEAAQAEIEDVIKKIRARLEQAAAVARLAESCIDARNPDQALTVVLDAEQPIQEVSTFLNAASLINRRAIA